MAVQNFRLTEAETDDFFRAKVGVIWDSLLDYPMEEFTVVLSYFQGKVGGTRYGRLNLNPAIVEAFKAQKTRKDIIWHKGDVLPVNITSLIPTETYTFTVRNISRLGLESPLKTIRHPMRKSAGLQSGPISNQHEFSSHHFLKFVSWQNYQPISDCQLLSNWRWSSQIRLVFLPIWLQSRIELLCCSESRRVSVGLKPIK